MGLSNPRSQSKGVKQQVALEVQDIRQAIDDALKQKVAECIINGDTPDDPHSELGKVQVIRATVARISDEAINEALTKLFVEARQTLNL